MSRTCQSPLSPTPLLKKLPSPSEAKGSQDLIDEILSVLPKQPSWITRTGHLYKYGGFWFSGLQLRSLLVCRQHFQPQDTDIILASAPKSGTTWLKAITFALSYRSQHTDFHNNHPLLKKNPHDLVPYLELSLYTNPDVLPDLASFPAPRLFASHLPYILLPESTKTSKAKLVYICRNPRDTFVSFWHFANKQIEKGMSPLSLEEGFDRFCRGVHIYGPYWDHVLEYWRESTEKPEKILFLKYEELKKQPCKEVKRLAEFLGCPITPEEESRGMIDELLGLCSFEGLRDLEVNKTGKQDSGMENSILFRRGEVGDWMNYFTSDMIERMDRITGEKLKGTNFKF